MCQEVLKETKTAEQVVSCDIKEEKMWRESEVEGKGVKDQQSYK